METITRPAGDGNFVAAVTAKPEGLKLWAMQYIERYEIREPDRLRQQMESFFFEGWSLYRSPDEPGPTDRADDKLIRYERVTIGSQVQK